MQDPKKIKESTQNSYWCQMPHIPVLEQLLQTAYLAWSRSPIPQQILSDEKVLYSNIL